MTDKAALDTSLRFGHEWDRYREFFPHYEQQFLGWISPLDPSEFEGKEVLDAGCGMGRNSYWAVKHGARHVVASDYSELAINSCREVLEDVPEVDVVHESIYDLDYDERFDIAYSLGVVHHLEHPRRAVERLVPTVRRGGKLVVWLYGYEGNEGWVRLMKASLPILRRLPPVLVHPLAYLCSVPIYLALKLPIPKSEYMAEIKEFPFAHLHGIVYDQLLPDVARYYRRSEVEELFSDLDVTKVGIHHNRGYSWTVICER